MKHRLLALIAGFALFAAPAFADQKIKVGISGGDAEIVWVKVKEIAAKDGLDVQWWSLTTIFCLMPRSTLATSTQMPSSTNPFLDNQIKTRGYKITAVGETIVAPIGLY